MRHRGVTASESCVRRTPQSLHSTVPSGHWHCGFKPGMNGLGPPFVPSAHPSCPRLLHQKYPMTAPWPVLASTFASLRNDATLHLLAGSLPAKDEEVLNGQNNGSHSWRHECWSRRGVVKKTSHKHKHASGPKPTKTSVVVLRSFKEQASNIPRHSGTCT
ncbi:hypothetical protein J6590_061717 [Homalodisca vitripennis]|nr:hypothetical protein J6590_061717 [Homalodisca vitripennis]